MAGSIAELSKYRYERALEELKNAKEVFTTGSYKLALNRSYYAIFHAMRAVNVLDEFDSSKHSGVIAHFNQYHNILLHVRLLIYSSLIICLYIFTNSA